MAAVDTPVPPGPVTATTVPRHCGEMGLASNSVAGASLRRIVRAHAAKAWTRSSLVKLGASTRAAPNDGQSRVARPSSTISTAQSAAVAAASRSRSTAGKPASATRAENGRPEASRARTSSADTHFRNSAGRAPDVAQTPTERNQAARAGARPRTTNRSPAITAPARAAGTPEEVRRRWGPPWCG